MKSSNKQINKSCFFLGAVILLYLGLSLFNFDLVKDGVQFMINVLIKILPILLIVFTINFIVVRYLKEEKIIKHLGKDSGKWGFFYAIITGLLISGPPYVLFPLLKNLKERGMKDSLIAILLYNRNVKIPFIPVMVYYFGLAFTIIISIYIIIFSLLNGFLMSLFLKENKK